MFTLCTTVFTVKLKLLCCFVLFWFCRRSVLWPTWVWHQTDWRTAASLSCPGLHFLFTWNTCRCSSVCFCSCLRFYVFAQVPAFMFDAGESEPVRKPVCDLNRTPEHPDVHERSFPFPDSFKPSGCVLITVISSSSNNDKTSTRTNWSKQMFLFKFKL